MGKGKKSKNKCPLCSKAYQSKKDLERHCLNYHEKQLSDIIKEKGQSRMTLGDFMKEGD